MRERKYYQMPESTVTNRMMWDITKPFRRRVYGTLSILFMPVVLSTLFDPVAALTVTVAVRSGRRRASRERRTSLPLLQGGSKW